MMGGIGFANAIGFGPAMEQTPASEIIRYWQILDSNMGARMPVFGMSLLITLIVTCILAYRHSSRISFYCILFALVFQFADLAAGIYYNFPFNSYLQAIQLPEVPHDFEARRQEAILGFQLRSVCMIGSFVAVLASAYGFFNLPVVERESYPANR